MGSQHVGELCQDTGYPDISKPSPENVVLARILLVFSLRLSPLIFIYGLYDNHVQVENAQLALAANESRYRHITKGQSEAEVEKLFGGPGMPVSGARVRQREVDIAENAPDGGVIWRKGKIPFNQAPTWRKWRQFGHDAWITVGFMTWPGGLREVIAKTKSGF